MKATTNQVQAVLATVAMGVLVLAACAPAGPAPTPTSVPGVIQAPLTPAPSPTPLLKPAPPAAAKPQSGGILNANINADAAHYDAHQSRSLSEQHPTAPLYSSLVQYGPLDDSQIEPDLAERWEMSPDGKSYTFYLHQGVKFHDGQPLTSADVKVSFEKIVWPPKGVQSPRAELFTGIEKIETPDDYTVRFRLKFPQAAFLRVVGMPFNFVFPKHILDKKGDMKKDLVGTGPFKVKSFMRGVSYEVERNPDYFKKGLPYLDGLTRYVITDEGAVLAALQTRRIHLTLPGLNNIRGIQLERLRRDYPDLVVQQAASQSRVWVMPQNERKPWNDVRVRKALYLAIDRQAALKTVMQGDGVVGGFVPPGPFAIPQENLLKMPGYRQPKDQDIAEAKRLLAEAGFPEGFKTTLTARSDLKFYADSVVFAQSELAKIGIDAKVELLLQAAYFNRSFAHDFDLQAGGAGSSFDDPDATFGEIHLTTSPGNYGAYKNPRMDELYYKQQREADPKKRKEIVLEMQRIMMEEDYPMALLFWRGVSAIFWPEVRDYKISSFGSSWHPQRFEVVWLAK